MEPSINGTYISEYTAERRRERTGQHSPHHRRRRVLNRAKGGKEVTPGGGRARRSYKDTASEEWRFWGIVDQMAEWSKALALGASLFGGAGSNPVLINILDARYEGLRSKGHE